ncbi:MAG: LamG-like jellyroll fold domain-containing protein, partial [Cocleimonas sp.]
MTFQVSSWLSLSKILFILLTLACSHSIKASDLLSDDFNPATQEQNPTWRFYDPYNLDNDTDNANSNEANEATLTLDGTNALISIPNGVTHDLWTPDNKAPRVLQPASDTDFQVEVKFETEPKIKHQLQGIIVQQTDEIFLRFDIFYNISEVAVFVAYIDNTTGNTTPYTLHHGPIGLGLAAFPNYQRVERSGDDWIFSYSSDGVNWTSLASFTQPITVTEVGFFAGTASSNPKFLSSVDYFIDLEDESPSIDVDTWIPPSTPLPVINTWYDHPETADSTIDFGLAGIPQPWANILGNVSSDINILTLSYTLNGGSGQALPMGANGNRLEREGDFNIEIDQANLLVGPNTIVIRAEDDNNQVVTKTVIINYAPANIGMPPYAVDWSSLSNNIQDVESIAHVVDGLWNLPTGGGIRTTETGYDRAIAIGDYETWLSDNYEITVPFTPHSNFAGIGFAVGWQGHIGSQSPRIEWPAQALAWVRGPVTSPRLEVLTYGGLPTSTWEVPVGTHEDLAPLTFNQKYILKSYSEPLSNGTSRFHVKFWQDGNVEPSDWNIQADVPTRDGSVLLVAYDGDITFGNVNITPVTITPPDTTPPVISNIQTTVTDSTATLSWTTDEPSNSVVDYGLNNNYGINVNDSIQTTTHSLILTGLNSNTLYHYQIKSSDSNGNVANSTDLELTTSTITTPSDSWWNNNWNYRASLTVHSGNHVRFEKPVETSINFTDYLTTADQATPFDVNSMRVHEVNASGAVITENIPFQFDPAIDFNATTKAEGNLIFLLSGNTASQANRYFQVYFDVEGGGYTASVFTDQVNVTDNIIDEGQSSFKIETDNASYFYQKEAGGFSSIVDNNGNDWISYHPAASGVSGAAGVYRGLPNLVFPEGYFHPGSTDASSTLLHEGPLKATIESVTNDNLWKVKWEFFPTFSRMTVTQADKNFWFLYEGTPGGTLDISDFVMRSNGVQNSVTESWTSDISNPEWVYFADPNVGNGRSLFVAHHNDDSAIDSYFPLDSATDLQMTVFGFGREGTNSSIDKNQTHQFTLGLTDSTDFSNTAGTIESAYNAITSTITANAQNPGNTGSDTTPPVVSNIQTVVTDTTATITWTTDEASSGKVNYGLDNTYGSNAVDSNTVLGTAHSVTLNGLTAGTEYHFEVVSTDESGNNSLPVDQVLTTDGASNNTPPIAADDSYTTSVEIALAVNIANGVLANDSDSDLDSITALLVDNVSNGTLTLNDDGSFNYIPNTGYSGTDSFTYQANDSLINSNLATVTITVTNSTGFCGKALQFDGANDWVNIPNLSFSGDFSIEAWVYLEPGIDSKDGLVGQEGTGQDINFYQGKVHLWAPNDVLVANTAMSASTWNHIAITRSSGNLTAYLNGVEDGTGVWTGVFAPKAIGRTNKGFLNGRLDEVRIWDIARNSTEIAANYNKSVATNSVGLVGYWTFNDDSNAQQVLDSSSSANSAFKGLDADASTDDPVQTNGSTLLNEDCAIGNTNVAPLINAGTDQTIILPSNATLSGIVSDDGLPTPPGAVTTLWTVISGPGTVTFTDATQLDTTASFSLDGTYVLDLTADDGELTSNDQLTIIVNAEGAANTAPTIHAGADQTLLLPSNATLSGIVSDDGLP